MKKYNMFIKIGYILALVCFLISIIFRSTIEREQVRMFLAIGGCLLIITNISKIIIDKKNKKI